MNPKMLLRLRRLAIIPRWTVVPTIRTQNVAEHSFHVAWIAAWLSTLSEPSLIKLDRLLWLALVHDEAESHSGDLAACFKQGDIKEVYSEYERRYSLGVYGIEGLSDQERCIIKVADYLEAMLFLREEQMMGNGFLVEVFIDVWQKFEIAWEKFRWAITDEDPVKPNPAMLWERFLNTINLTRHPGMWDVR